MTTNGTSSNGTTPAGADWTDYIDQAVEHHDRGEYRQAIYYYELMIELAPEEPTLYRARGNAYAELGAYDQAIDDLQKAIRLDAQYSDAYLDLADIYQGMCARLA